jgi:hypothetical protein
MIFLGVEFGVSLIAKSVDRDCWTMIHWFQSRKRVEKGHVSYFPSIRRDRLIVSASAYRAIPRTR